MWWLWGTLFVLLAATTGWYIVRLRFISSRIGSFHCSLMRGDRWVEGYACYAVGRLDWFPIMSIASRPAQSWTRGDCDVVSVEYTDGGSHAHVVVRGDGDDVMLGMPGAAYSGLRSWLESAPPTPSTYK